MISLSTEKTQTSYSDNHDLALITYPNKQRNFSEFITFSSKDSG